MNPIVGNNAVFKMMWSVRYQDVRGVTHVVAGGDVGVGLGVGGRGVTGGGSGGAVRHGQEGGQHNLRRKKN